MKLLFSTFFLLAPALAFARPAVTGVEGAFENKKVVRVVGSGFGEKDPATPLVWADFENGLQPTALGRKTSWDGVQSMEEAPRGWHGKGARASDGSGRWTLRVDYKYWTKEGQKLYIFKHQKMNFVITDASQNWKVWRMWPETANYPNIYAAAHNGRVFVENVGPESGFWGDFKNKSDDWGAEEIIARASSAMNLKDGLFILKYNGAETASGTIMTRSTAAPEYMVKNYVVHGVLANKERWHPVWSDTNRLWVDDVYVDTGWSRVLLGDEPTAEASRHWEVQIPSAWSDSTVTVHVNTGAFLPNTVVYLYVYDANGVVNEQGFPIQLPGGNVHG